MGRVRYAWVTLLPLCWLLAVTMTAGAMKIFSADPRLGFLSGARALNVKLALAATPAESASLQRQIFNAHVDAAVTGVFLLLVVFVLIANARVWWRFLAGNREPALREEPYVALATEPAVR